MTRTFALLVVFALASSTACRTERPPQALAVEERGDFVIVHLKHAGCGEIVATINELLEAGREATRLGGWGCVIGPPPWPNPQPGLVASEAQVVAVPESNSVMIRAPIEDMPRVVELISRLGGDAHVQGRAGRE